MNSDFISNIDLGGALKEHFKGLHEVDKSQLTEEEQARTLILTKVFVKSDFMDPCRSAS